MSFKMEQCKKDARMMAETCRILSADLAPQEQAYFFSTLIDELSFDRDFATKLSQPMKPAA
jgi:hypothetical protein